MEPSQRLTTSPDPDASPSVGETPVNQLRSQSHRGGSRDQMQLETNSHELGQHGRQYLHLAFQDSNLSPALSLLPVNSRPENSVTDFSFFQHTGTEFAPLRPYPDVSMATERFHTTQASEQESLSQHPLAQATILTEEGASSCSLSQHSFSPGDQSRRGEKGRTPMISSKDGAGRSEATRRDIQLEAAKDETSFLSEDISAKCLLDILQKDVGVRSGSSIAVSSVSEMSIRSSASSTDEYKSAKREGPSGKASFPPQRTQQPDRVSNPGQSQARSSEVFNITTGSRGTQPDEQSEALHRELLLQVERRTSCEAGSENAKQNSSQAPFQSVTPNLNELTADKTTGVQASVGGVTSTGPFSAGVERIQRENDLWSSGNQTGIDGSYLGFLPQSQSTPGIFGAPPKSSVKPKIGRLSAIESSKDNSYQSSSGFSRQPVVPSPEPRHTHSSNHHQTSASSAEVQSLPSLNYMQKVDAWRANQSSAKTSLFDSLALQGFSGVSPKKKAHDAVADSLNRILSQQAKSLQQPVSTSAPTQSVPQSCSTAPPGSSSPRGETVGRAPSEKDASVSAAPPSSSPFGRSQSYSSLNTVMSANVEQQAEQQKGHGEEDARHDSPGSDVRPSTLTSLGHFSDVSLDQDLTLSSSQDSYSGVKKHTSIGASSVVSLEIDNYAPYWNSKRSTPPPLPKPRELNIDERIPLYLHNLGIDQSPSAILNPFALRGPIREAEFSPTGTPARSIQASEVGSPKKVEFSRASIHSVDSSVSIPFSMDSLGPAVSLPEQAGRSPPPPEAGAPHADRRLTPGSKPGSKPHEEAFWSLPRPGQQAQSSRTVGLLGERVEPPSSVGIKVSCGETNLEAFLQTSRSTDEAAEDSIVSAKAFSEIRRLLSHAEDMRSTGSSSSSSAPPPAHQLIPDQGSSFPLKNKSSRLQDSSFSSSFTAGDPKTPSSLQWTGSSSESLLSSDKQRQLSVGRDGTSSSWQPDYTSTQPPGTSPAIAPHKTPEDSAAGADGGADVLSKSFRRTEPEGCSAAPPDNAPQQRLVSKTPPDVNAQQPKEQQPKEQQPKEQQPKEQQPTEQHLTEQQPTEQHLTEQHLTEQHLTEQQPTSPPADAAEVADVEETTPPSPAPSSSSSPVLEGADHHGMSDGSSESSLAVRVAKLLQRESPSTTMSSKPSSTDHKERQAREWIKLKVSGRQCEPLELNPEDIKWIEKFKRELDLKNRMQSQGSSDMESSSTSSAGAPEQPGLLQLAAVSDADTQPPPSLQGLRTNPSDSTPPPRRSTQPDLEAQVCEIAAREGVVLPCRKSRALTSITIATCRRSTSPSPSSSTAPPHSPAPEPAPLHLMDLSTGADSRQLDTHSADKSLNSTTSQSAPGDQRGRFTMGARFEEAPPPSQPSDVTIQLDGAATHQSVESSRKGHISHVHLTLSPKVPDHTTADLSSRPAATTDLSSRPATTDLSSRPAATTDLSSRPAATTDLSSRPAATTDLSSRPAATTDLSSRPAATDLSSRPATTDLSSRPAATTDLSSCPAATDLSSRPATTDLSSRPAATTDLSSRPAAAAAATANLSSRPAAATDLSSRPAAPSQRPHKEFVPLRQSSPAASSPDEGVVLSSPPEWCDYREPARQRAPERSNTSSLLTAADTSSRFFTARHRTEISPRRLQAQTPAAVLLPYKPHGSEELFYVPHVEADRSSAEPSDTTMESSHPGSDDAVPPRFSSEVLGRREPGVDRGVAIRHTEGIYSKRLKTATFKMNEPPNRDAPEASDKSSPTDQSPDSSPQVSVAVNRVPLLKRDQGTSPIPFLLHEPEPSRDSFKPVQSPVCLSGREREQPAADAELQLSSLDQLWKRFCLQWTVEQQHLSRDRETSLLERLEHLSGLLHLPEGREEVDRRRERREDVREVRRSLLGGTEQRVHRGRRAESPIHQQERLPPADDHSRSSVSSVSSVRPHSSPESLPVSTADASSSPSGSMSTVDTARLVRVFGAHKVQQLRSSSSLSKLYSAIYRQREGGDDRRERSSRPPHITLTVTRTEESFVADSTSSTSSSSVPPPCGASRTLGAKKTVKLVNKGVQAGDIEIIPNATCRHTRDVGTTFPSPSDERGRGGQRSSPRGHSIHKQRKSRRSPLKPLPAAVSWFIPAGSLKSTSRKENQPEEAEPAARRRSAAWFEPYSRAKPWRRPLQPRLVQEEGNEEPGFTRHTAEDPDPRHKTSSSGRRRVSLQEALEIHRPDFISRSRQRVECLTQQAEERKLQAAYSRDGDELGGAERPPRPAGSVLLRRAVSRKEMIQRSKLIYESLPEVQRRREEERRKAEYRSYRLNAQLYNKRIRNRVLGRRPAWQ